MWPGTLRTGECGRADPTRTKPEPRKFYVDDGEVEIIRHLVYELDAEGRRLTCRHLSDYASEKVRNVVSERFRASRGLA